MVKKLSCVIPLMVLLSCSSDSNDPVMPIAGENHLSSSDAENLRGTSSDSGSEHNDSSTGENLSSDGSDEILSSGSPDKPLSNGTSLSSGIPLSSSSSVSSGSVSASSVVENGSELKYQVFDVTTSASSQGYIKFLMSPQVLQARAILRAVKFNLLVMNLFLTEKFRCQPTFTTPISMLMGNTTTSALLVQGELVLTR